MWRPDTDIKHDIQLTFDISMWLTTVDKGDVKTCTVSNNNLKLGIQFKPVTGGADATEYVWPTETDHLRLHQHQLHMKEAQTKCGESAYFWDSVVGNFHAAKAEKAPD